MPTWLEEKKKREATAAQIVEVLRAVASASKRPLKHSFHIEVDFTAMKDVVDRCSEMAQRLVDAETDEKSVSALPGHFITTLENAFKPLNGALAQINQFVVKKETTPAEHLENVRTNVWNFMLQAENAAAQALVQIALDGPLVRTRMATADAALAELHQEAAEARGTAAQMKKLLDEIRGLAPTAAVAHHERNFDTTMKDHKEVAQNWLIACVAMVGALATVLYVGLHYYGVKEDAPSFTPFVIQSLAAKAVAVSIAYYALSVCLRNYRVNRHLAVVNEHRRNALKTFQIFADAAIDDPTRAAVLLETTKCIFAPAATGYTGPEDEVTPQKFLELIKGAAPKS